eukprot:4751450-Prymnesium_polylepis.1
MAYIPYMTWYGSSMMHTSAAVPQLTQLADGARLLGPRDVAQGAREEHLSADPVQADAELALLALAHEHVSATRTGVARPDVERDDNEGKREDADGVVAVHQASHRAELAPAGLTLERAAGVHVLPQLR